MSSKASNRLKITLNEDRKILSKQSEKDLRKKIATVISQYFAIDKRKIRINIIKTNHQAEYKLTADMPIKKSELEKE